MTGIVVAALERLPEEQEVQQLWLLAGQLYSAQPELAEVEANIATIVTSDSRQLFVARSSGVILGQLVFTEMVESGPRYGHIGGVVVDSIARGRGIASSLVAAALEDGSRRGLTRFDLTSSKPPAQRMYRMLGFEDIDTRVMRLRKDG